VAVLEHSRERCARGELWKVWDPDAREHSEQLLSIEEVNLYHFIDTVGKPSTAFDTVACFVVELLADGPKEPVFFVSHAWSEPIHLFVAVVVQHACDREVLLDVPSWVCGYAINQHQIDEAIDDDPQRSAFFVSIRASRGMLALYDPQRSTVRASCSSARGVASRQTPRALPRGCLLLYPLVFSNAAAVDVEVLLVSSRAIVGVAHAACEGAIGELFADENSRPSVRSIGLPDAKTRSQRYRGVPMLAALARWRRAGVLKPLDTAPLQIVLFVTRKTYVEPVPPPPSPPSPPNGTSPEGSTACQVDPDYGSEWCAERTHRCGRPIFDERCAETCGLCAPNPPPFPPPPPAVPPASDDGLTRIGDAVPTAGRTPVDCLRSLLELDTLGLGSRGRTTRLASLGLIDAELQRRRER
jgi:hypothetical protein